MSSLRFCETLHLLKVKSDPWNLVFFSTVCTVYLNHVYSLSVMYQRYGLFLGVVTNPMMQQPMMSGGLEVVSPITFPEDHDDPRVTQDNTSAGGIWGFIKVRGYKPGP